MSTHRQLSGQQLHEPFHYAQDDDPGAVGAGKYWLELSTGLIHRRNTGDTAWDIVGGSDLSFAILNAANIFTSTLNTFTQGLIIHTEVAVSAFVVDGDGTISLATTGPVEIPNASSFNRTGPSQFIGSFTLNGNEILTSAVTSAKALGITGLTGGGASKLDGISSAAALNRIIIFYTGTGIEFWMLLNEVHVEDGISYIQPDDDATKSWIKLG